MPTYGDPPGWQQRWTLSDNTTWSGSFSGTDITVYPAVVAMPQPPTAKPDDSGPLGWLRGQVAEICELATAA
jgi:hypothetical protein